MSSPAPEEAEPIASEGQSMLTVEERAPMPGAFLPAAVGSSSLEDDDDLIGLPRDDRKEDYGQATVVRPIKGMPAGASHPDVGGIGSTKPGSDPVKGIPLAGGVNGETGVVKTSYWATKYQEVAKHAHEHNRDPAWFRHEKHIIIFSWAGRPIFTRYGDETKLAAFIGVISAFVSNFQRLKDQIKAIFAGDYKIVFLFKGPIHLVAISRTRESVQQLQQQLNYAHDQIISVLGGGAHAVLEARPNYDLRSSMAGTELLLNDIINEADRSPAQLFEALQVMRISSATRSRVHSALKRGSRSKSLLYSLLIAGGRLVNIVKPKERVLHASDLHILINFVTNSQSLRSSESWTPICLPRFSDKGFLYAYVCFVAEDVCLTFVTGDQSDFYTLHEARIEVTAALDSKGTLEEIKQAMTLQDWTVDSLDLGCPDVRHFLYKNEILNQYVMAAPADPYLVANDHASSRKELFRTYQHVCSRLGSGAHVRTSDRRHLVYYEVTNNACVLGWVRPGEFELYVTLLPTATKEMALAGSHRVLRWLKREEQNLFIL